MQSQSQENTPRKTNFNQNKNLNQYSKIRSKSKKRNINKIENQNVKEMKGLSKVNSIKKEDHFTNGKKKKRRNKKMKDKMFIKTTNYATLMHFTHKIKDNKDFNELVARIVENPIFVYSEDLEEINDAKQNYSFKRFCAITSTHFLCYTSKIMSQLNPNNPIFAIDLANIAEIKFDNSFISNQSLKKRRYYFTIFTN